MMTLKDTIQENVKQAMRDRDRKKLGVLRLVTAAIKQKEVDERIDLDDAAILAVLEKMTKQRRESLEQYEKAGRDDLAGQERFELELLQHYMPEPLGEAQLVELIDQAIAASGAESMRDMGPVMAAVKEQAQGRADMKAVSNLVRARLSGQG